VDGESCALSPTKVSIQPRFLEKHGQGLVGKVGREKKENSCLPGGTSTLPPGALTSTSGGGVECDAPIVLALHSPVEVDGVRCGTVL
jgi:hypothetical protein